MTEAEEHDGEEAPGGGIESHLPADSRLLQKEVLNAGALDHPAGVEVDVNVLPEAAGVVIPDSLGIAKG